MFSRIAIAAVIGSALISTGCTTHLSHGQKRELSAYKEKGFYQAEKNVAVAAGLGVFPVLGYMYTGHPVLAVTSVLTWPFLGPLWMPHDTSQSALNRNYYATKEFVAREKAKEMRGIDHQLEEEKINYQQHVRLQRELEEKYSPY